MPLTEEQKKQIDTNIRSMLENGASQTDVESYAKDFKAKYEPVEKKSEVGVVAGSESQSSGSVTDLYKQGTTETAVTELAAKTNENVSQTASYKEGDKYTLNGNIYTYKSNDTWVRRENNEQGGQDGFQIENKDFGQFISGGEAQPLKTFKYSGIDYRYNPTDKKFEWTKTLYQFQIDAVHQAVEIIKKYGFKPWGWYRIIAGILLLIYFGWVK